MKKILLTPQITIEGKEIPALSLIIGKAYMLYSPIESFASKVLIKNIIPNVKIVEEDIDAINDFILKFDNFTIKDFFYEYDKYSIGELLLNFERDCKIDFTTQLFDLDAYDRKCIYLTYLINSLPRKNILLAVNTIALSFKSSYRFTKCLQQIVEIVKDISIVHVEDLGMEYQSKSMIINSFKIYDLSQLNINSTVDYINFSIEHYEKTNLTQD